MPARSKTSGPTTWSRIRCACCGSGTPGLDWEALDESMTRAPFVQGKATEAFARKAEIYDTTIGWRFVNGLMKTMYGTDSMPETGENVAEQFQATRRALVTMCIGVGQGIAALIERV
jgi:acetyl-CoA acetyltransferase